MKLSTFSLCWQTLWCIKQICLSERHNNIRGTPSCIYTFLVNKFSASIECTLLVEMVIGDRLSSKANCQSVIIHYKVENFFRGFNSPGFTDAPKSAQSSLSLKFSTPLCNCRNSRGRVSQCLLHITNISCDVNPFKYKYLHTHVYWSITVRTSCFPCWRQTAYDVNGQTWSKYRWSLLSESKNKPGLLLK